jgi:hypothetical protein
MKSDPATWMKRRFSISVIANGTHYYTTEEPFMASPEEAQAAIDQLVGIIDEKIMLVQRGGNSGKVPALRLSGRYRNSTHRYETVIISAQVLASSPVSIILIEEKA